MFSLKNIRISQKFNFLIVIIIFCFSAVGASYFVHVSSEQEAQQQKIFFDGNERLLDSIRVDLVKLNQLLAKRFSSSHESVRSESPNNPQFQLRTSLTENLSTLMARSQNPRILSELKQIEQQLNSFDSLSQQLVFQNESMGENAESGLLLEIAIGAEQFEAVLIEMGSASIKLAVLDIRADEKSLIEYSSIEKLLQIDEKIYSLVALVSGVRQSTEKLDSIMSVVDGYSKDLSQLVTMVEDITSLEMNLVSVGEKLTAALSGVRVTATEYTKSEVKVLELETQLLFKVFIAVAVLALALVLASVVLLRKAVLSPLTQILDVLNQLNEGELGERVDKPTKSEFGKLAQALNQFLDSSVRVLDDSARELKATVEELNAQSGDIDTLCSAVESMSPGKTLVLLPVSEGRVGNVATSVNTLNHAFFEFVEKVKKASHSVDDLSAQVLKQSVSIGRVANDELKQILVTNKALKLSTRAMEEIVVRTKAADDMAGMICSGLSGAISTTAASVKSHESIQSSISSVEKRMEGLLELSQNIQVIADSMNGVADRSHIIALNMSMSSATLDDDCSESEDVKALAQHAKQASKDVLSIIESTRNDLFDTINTMNNMVESVVVGFDCVESMSKQLTQADESVKQLADVVRVVAGGSDRQASLLKKVYERSDAVRQYIETSGKKIQNQQRDANNLKNQSEGFISFLDNMQLPKEWQEPVPKTESRQESTEIPEEQV